MRRSKSDPAKYARNYRKISQRRMTQYDHVNEEQEIERLRSILRDSEAHLKGTEEDENDELRKKGSKRKRKHDKNHPTHTHGNGLERDSSILSHELLAEGTGDELIFLPSKKKAKVKQSKIQLTAEEIKEAKNMQKKTARKLQQLETRAAQKKQRAALYEKLGQHQISSTALGLLSRSGKISRKDTETKKQALQRLVKKERAGIELTEEEKDLLYPERHREDTPETLLTKKDGFSNKQYPRNDPRNATKKRNKESLMDITEEKNEDDKEVRENVAHPPTLHFQPIDGSSSETLSDAEQEKSKSSTSKTHEATNEGFDFAAQMMASLSKLKDDTEKKAEENLMNAGFDDNDKPGYSPFEKYVPSEPTQLKTAATLGISNVSLEIKRKVLPIQRPEAVEDARYNLPVSAMEFEIMDAIRNNDVTIVCGETGSGKSTQVPQFLYEAGMCLNEADPSGTFLIGITQPRRVAAVSTAKRVCYEMGCGDGQTIKGSGSKGNTVSYRTRYETAGSGTETCIQFMTDGILLQEIQTDLLLRRYSVIVLDESHERNLNTDVLIGLLSVALPLRKKAAAEDPSLVPLKLVLMSATLRVEDFTNNDKLFPTGPPMVVHVPGRTFPVTVHHSKATELDNYETVAFRKICKIHRKLPQGGILVFLTGKGEIIRMVNKLRRALNQSLGNQQHCTGIHDVNEQVRLVDNQAPREMDDEELDAEDVLEDDFDSMEDDETLQLISKNDESSADDNIPKHAYVLPLYSLLSSEEQAKVFEPVPGNHRLIVVATNIAETSITIPGISYVVDTGRQKCRNYNSGTGVASYDIMWISKAAADQRAGRAGRTGPGHCYRLYSSSLYSRHMDSFALPEVLSRPLEDVVLAMKALNVSNVSCFPFPTPPDRKQIEAAVKVLANIGCVDVSSVERDGGDGTVTKLGQAVAKLPLGVRYAKILLVAAQAGVLDYAIVLVSILAENSPFEHGASRKEDEDNLKSDSDDESMNEIDKAKLKEVESHEKKYRKRWQHRNGDILAAMLAVGAYTFAGKGAGGVAEQLASRKFCEENGLNYVVMARIQKMRKHLANLAKNRLSTASGFAAKSGGFSSKMTPPNQLQERLLVQAITSGLLDNVALLAPPGSISGEHPFGLRSAYLSSSTFSKDPLYIDRNSTLFSRDFRQLSQWVCYDRVVLKTLKDGSSVKVMKNVTPVDPSWLGELAKGTKLLSLGGPIPSPPPIYDIEQDAVLCAVSTKFGTHGWEIPPIKQDMFQCLQSPEARQNPDFLLDDSFRWFARFLLEGKVLPELHPLGDLLNDRPMIVTRKTPVTKVSILVSALAGAGVDSASALRKHWAEKDDKFLFKQLKGWIKPECQSEAKKLWIQVVKLNIKIWNARNDKDLSRI